MQTALSPTNAGADPIDPPAALRVDFALDAPDVARAFKDPSRNGQWGLTDDLGLVEFLFFG